MMVMTAKVDLKKILVLIAVAAALLLVAIALLGGGGKDTADAAQFVSGNDGRVAFLKNFGWEVSDTPTESGQVQIPKETSPVFERYNALQKGQGYDLTEYAGKTVIRYVYQIQNYPGASGPVYATMLVQGDRVIGGDVTDTSPGGKIRAFQMPEGTVPTTQPATASTPQTSE